MVIIDPALAFLGGDVNSQNDVSAFLRTDLHPILKRYDVAAIVVHHTNKVTKKNGMEVSAYAGSGSAEWANWARAAWVLEPCGNGIYKLVGAKRGARLGWVGEDGVTISFDRFIQHCKSKGRIFWEYSKEPKGTQSRKFTLEDLANVLTEPMRKTEWLTKAMKSLGMGERTFYSLSKECVETGLAIKVGLKYQKTPI